MLDRPKLTATVVGEVEPVGCLSCDTALFAPGELPGGEPSVELDPESVFFLVDLPDGLSLQDLQALQGAGPAALDVREVRLSSPYYVVGENDTGGGAVRWSLVIGALVLTVVGVVVSAAFAVGARRQREVREGLDDTGVVVLVPVGGGSRWVEGPVSVVTPDGRRVPGVAVPHRYTPGYSSLILLSNTVVADLGLEIQPIATLFETAEPFTSEQRSALEDLQFDLQVTGATDTYVDIQWASPSSGPSPFQLELILTGLALVFSLFVVGVSLALAAAESKDERDILTIAGAPPGTLARSAGARAWLLAVIGTSMAVPVGFLPMIVFATAQAQDQSGGNVDNTFPLVFPTRTVLLLVLAVPIIVAVVSFASSAAAQRLRPVRVSTATFE